MKRIWLGTGLVVVVGAAGLWWRGLMPHQREPASQDQQLQRDSSNTMAAILPPSHGSTGPQVRGRPGTPVVTPSDAAAQTLSPLVERLRREGHRAARPSELQSLTSAEQRVLVNAYRQIASITNKLGIARTLAYAGDAQVGAELWWSLTQEYAGRVFDNPAEPADLSRLVQFLGLVADKDDVTYRRLEQGVNPEFWHTNISWRPPALMADRAQTLARYAIEALVLSGRPEGWQTVLNLASNPPPWFARAGAAYYVTLGKAAYQRDMIQRHGRAWYWENCPGDINRLAGWMRSDAGRPWREWQQRMVRPLR